MPLPGQGIAQWFEELGPFLTRQIFHALRQRLPVVTRLTGSRRRCLEECIAGRCDDLASFVIEFDLVTEDGLHPRRYIRRQD